MTAELSINARFEAPWGTMLASGELFLWRLIPGLPDMHVISQMLQSDKISRSESER